MSATPRTSFAQLLLGAWLAWTVAAGAVAIGAFGVANDLATPDAGDSSAREAGETTAREAGETTAREAGETPGHAEWRAAVTRPRAVARFQAAELNRWAFTASARGQLVLAGLALVTLAWPRPRGTLVVGAVSLAALLVTVELVVLLPWAEQSAAALAMAPEPRPPELDAATAAMATAHRLHGVADLAKIGLLLVASWALARPRAAAGTSVDV